MKFETLADVTRNPHASLSDAGAFGKCLEIGAVSFRIPQSRSGSLPWVADAPRHHMATCQMSQFGGMLSFQVKGGKNGPMAVAAKVKVFTRATSLGGLESLIEHRASIEPPETMTPQDLLRVSVGLEHADDLMAGLEQALN